VYIEKILAHERRFAIQTTVFACFLTRCSAGINIDINNAMIEITTSSSIKVNPVRNLLVPRLEILISNGVNAIRFFTMLLFSSDQITFLNRLLIHHLLSPNVCQMQEKSKKV